MAEPQRPSLEADPRGKAYAQGLSPSIEAQPNETQQNDLGKGISQGLSQDAQTSFKTEIID